MLEYKNHCYLPLFFAKTRKNSLTAMQNTTESKHSAYNYDENKEFSLRLKKYAITEY